jgi:serine/threonine protein phosphatase PrpC
MNTQMGNQCPACGEENRSGARFCAHCGRLLTDTLPIEAQAETESPVSLTDVQVPDPDKDETGADEAGLTKETAVSPPMSDFNPSALPPGLFLAGRYQIVEQVTATDALSPTYLVHDWGQCPACAAELEQHYTPDAPEFCTACGKQLDTPLICQLQQVTSTEVSTDHPLTPDSRYITHEGFFYLVQSINPPTEQLPKTPRYFRLRFGFQTHKGQVREIDEDSLLTLTMTTMIEGEGETVLGLFVVSDGIGGHQAGEVASREAVQLIGAEIISRVFQSTLSRKQRINEDKLSQALQSAVGKANRKIYELQQEIGNDMGATVTAVLIYHQHAIVANVGDSRTYLWRNGELTAVTQDHSLVASLIAAQQLPEEAIYTHEQKGMIYRSLGDKPDIPVDTFPLTLVSDDRLVLCCDGVWEMLRNEGIEEVLLLEPDPQRACDEMVKRANYAGGEDNITVIVIVVDPVY